MDDSNQFSISMKFSYSRNGTWYDIPEKAVSMNGFSYDTGDGLYGCEIVPGAGAGQYEYSLHFEALYPTQLRFKVTVAGEDDYFHVIPCNIHGDNNELEAAPGEFPFLSDSGRFPPYSSPRWEFRADRAATPISVLTFARGAVGISVDPYSDDVENGGESRDYIHNGVFAELPRSFGVTLGYTNDPVTFINKKMVGPPTADLACRAATRGTLYVAEGPGRQTIHQMIRAEYGKRHRRAEFSKSYQEAAAALVDTFVKFNWSRETNEYTNRKCRIPDHPKMAPWREVCEIGWTGGAVLAYPLILSRFVEGAVNEDTFREARSGEGIIERILHAVNPLTGLLYNYAKPKPGQSSWNIGWWEYAGDVHCAYTVGSAVHYILKAMDALDSAGEGYPYLWLDTCRDVTDRVIALQREDGSFGYTYGSTRPEVTDWDGFAGCWFAPAAAYLYKFTKDKRYLEAAKKALRFYRLPVTRLNCYGTPMDTRKSVDEEGNLAFIRGCRLVHEYTGEAEFLEDLIRGADYEYLWRYGYPSRPTYAPLKDGWNSCGGSVTSVSNPHIHPMGVIVDSDLRYLAKVTGDSYHRERAEDSTAWLMQTLELYPDQTGFGQYGTLSERWCPSDGLTIERYSDGTPSSTWFSYNLWAAANALEAVCEKYFEVRDGKSW